MSIGRGPNSSGLNLPIHREWSNDQQLSCPISVANRRIRILRQHSWSLSESNWGSKSRFFTCNPGISRAVFCKFQACSAWLTANFPRPGTAKPAIQSYIQYPTASILTACADRRQTLERSIAANGQVQWIEGLIKLRLAIRRFSPSKLMIAPRAIDWLRISFGGRLEGYRGTEVDATWVSPID